ncbi:MAG: thioredoxin [Euryarchaeota archaeon]|nr:thioredoxin [Methanosarcinales archaeon]MEA1907708.1 thioredoxin [Euryarchaeota archaeon]
MDELEAIRMRKMERLQKMTSGEVLILNDGNLDGIVHEYPLVVVDCWAEWCGPCKTIAPIIEALAKEYAGKVTFGKLNIDENMGVATTYQISAIPTMLVFKNGVLSGQIIGALPKAHIKQQLEEYM